MTPPNGGEGTGIVKKTASPLKGKREKMFNVKKWNKDKKQGFLAGAILPSLLLVMLLCMGAGTMQEIRVLKGGINIYVDGVLQEPKNANGETVEPMIYEGTTYLPVRALTNMLTDKTVTWDQSTKTVYIGAVPSKGKVTLDKLDTYGNPFLFKLYTGADAEFDFFGTKKSPMNRLDIEGFRGLNGYVMYQLGSNYSRLEGEVVMPNPTVGSHYGSGLAFYSVDRHGEKTLLQKVFTQTGDDPIQIDLDVLGVEFLRIESIHSLDADWPYDSTVSDNTYNIISFYNAVLTPVI